MLELAQHIQVFLHKHDRPPVSLYEEMVERQRAEERRERERKEKRETALQDQGGGTGTWLATSGWSQSLSGWSSLWAGKVAYIHVPMFQ